jgi:TolB-like protein
MSPEQARGQTVDKRTDIWAFGCVLYEMLTGQIAFRGETISDTIVAVLDREPNWSTLPNPTPMHVRHLLERCLAKNPKGRLRDIGDARLELDDTLTPDRTSLLLASDRRGRNGVKQGVAVLPLENLSRDPEQEYFADGMTDALITTLAQIRALRVISRTSVMRYKGARKTLPEIARELNVECVIEGSVVRSGDRVRIGAQLIDAATDTHLWARNYETDVRDVLALQSDVARSIADEVQIQLTPQEQAHLAGSRRVDPDAYEAFLKGRHHWYRRSPGSLERALEHLQRAIDIDPTYAPAHAGLADSYITLGWDLYGLRAPSETYPRAKEAARRALLLDPNCAEAYAALAWAATGYDWDWSAAEAAFPAGHRAEAAIWASPYLVLASLDGAGTPARLIRGKHARARVRPLGSLAEYALGMALLVLAQVSAGDRPAPEDFGSRCRLHPDPDVPRRSIRAGRHVCRRDRAVSESGRSFGSPADQSRRSRSCVRGLGQPERSARHRGRIEAALEQRVRFGTRGRRGLLGPR